MHAFNYLIPEVIETISEFPINDVKRCVVNRWCSKLLKNSLYKCFTQNKIKGIQVLSSIFCNIKEKMNLQQATGKEIFLGHLVMGEKPGFL